MVRMPVARNAPIARHSGCSADHLVSPERSLRERSSRLFSPVELLLHRTGIPPSDLSHASQRRRWRLAMRAACRLIPRRTRPPPQRLRYFSQRIPATFTIAGEGPHCRSRPTARPPIQDRVTSPAFFAGKPAHFIRLPSFSASERARRDAIGGIPTPCSNWPAIAGGRDAPRRNSRGVGLAFPIAVDERIRICGRVLGSRMRRGLYPDIVPRRRASDGSHLGVQVSKLEGFYTEGRMFVMRTAEV